MQMPKCVSTAHNEVMKTYFRSAVVMMLMVAAYGNVFAQAATSEEQPPVIEMTQPMEPVEPVVNPPEGAPMAGDPSITAAVVQAQDVLDKHLATTATANGSASTAANYANNSFSYYVAEYDDFQSTPYLFIMGLNLGKLLNDALFKFAMGSIMTAFVAIAISKKMTDGGGSPEFYGNLILKVFTAGLLLAYPSHIYAAARTIMNVGSEVVASMKKVADESPGGVVSRMTEVAAQSGTRDLQTRALRDKAIKSGLAARQGVFTRFVSQPILDEAGLDYWAYFFNQMAPAQAAAYSNAKSYTPIPRIGEAPVDEIRKQVLSRYVALTIDSASVSPGFTKSADFSVDWKFKDYALNKTEVSISPLSYSIQEITAATIAALNKTPSTAAGESARAELLSQYEKVVTQATANWIDSEYIDRLAVAMKGESRLWGIAKNIGTWTKRAGLSTAAALSPDSLADKVGSVLSIFTSVARTFVIPLISLVMCFCLRLLLELSLLGMLISIPFWFFDGTKKAFTGSVETLIATAIMVPFWQFFQMIMDLLFGALTSIVMLGAGVGAAAGGITAPTLVVLAIMMSLGYVVASLILAWKTPSLVKGFLAGGSWITSVVGAALTGVAAGGFMAVAAAAAIAAPVAAPLVGAGGAAASGSGGAGAATAGSGAMAAGGGAAATSSLGSATASAFRRGVSGAANGLKHLAMNDFKPHSAAMSYAKERQKKSEAQETVT